MSASGELDALLERHISMLKGYNMKKYGMLLVVSALVMSSVAGMDAAAGKPDAASTDTAASVATKGFWADSKELRSKYRGASVAIGAFAVIGGLTVAKGAFDFLFATPAQPANEAVVMGDEEGTVQPAQSLAGRFASKVKSFFKKN